MPVIINDLEVVLDPPEPAAPSAAAAAGAPAPEAPPAPAPRVLERIEAHRRRRAARLRAH